MVYSLNAFERESVPCPGVDTAFHSMFQNRPVALGKYKPEAQGCVSTRKARIDRFFRQVDLTRRCEATVVLRVPSRAFWLG
jgi:hypothetical protein